MRVILASLLLLASLTTLGQTYVQGIDLADSTLTFAIYHAQVKMEKHRNGFLELYWNRTDSNNYYKARVEVPSIIELDPNHPAKLTTQIFQRKSGRDTLLLEHSNSTIHTRNISLRLKAREGKAILQAGSHKMRNWVEVPIDLDHPGAFGTACSDHLTGVRHSLLYAAHAKVPVYQGLTKEKIIEQALKPTNPIEGLWQYFDRDIPQKRVRMGRKYTLAIISDGDDGYLVIDLSAPDGTLPLKGYITPTIFQNNYNLVWYPAKGPVQDDDCYAELSLEGHLLSINMPVIKSTFRLYRMPEKEINTLNDKKALENLHN